jgi:hypothetical protein
MPGARLRTSSPSFKTPFITNFATLPNVTAFTPSSPVDSLVKQKTVKRTEKRFVGFVQCIHRKNTKTAM